ncbi:hypothetical protein CLV84_4342 [Neolewinella xylanilytica]|uniref:Uncharacterized protein n=1 Tax=Neolewinella xylanilytica TaxID=1514080 RepID=A0A2S6HZX5_9BACT|nr:hypothetical protein [Neolewinella xylanilytica]PPK83796.1 hypothetical protein CLV84_4342 [Neolewinella xylanilytica]
MNQDNSEKDEQNLDYNLLEDWKGNVIFQSSILYHGKDKISLTNRDKIDLVTADISRWFGIDAFCGKRIEVNGKNFPNTVSHRWLSHLLAATNVKAVQTILEFWKVVKWHEREDADRLLRLKHFWNIADERKFRDYYFELYTFYLFGFNNYKYEFTGHLEGKHPEGYIFINDNRCLVECKKLYYHKFDDLWINGEILRRIILLLSNYPATVSILVRYADIGKGDVDNIIQVVSNKVNEIRNKEINAFYLPEEIEVNDNIKISFEITPPEYHQDFRDRADKLHDSYVYVISDPIILTDGTQRMLSKFSAGSRVSSNTIESQKRIIKAIRDKRAQWKDFEGQRIIVIESDNYPGFDRGLYIGNDYLKHDRRAVAAFLSQKTSKDAVIVITKESNTIDVPRVQLSVDATKQSLETGGVLKGLAIPKN